MLEKIKNKIEVFIRDLFINSIAASKLTPKSVRYIIYRIYGLEVFSKNISPNCFFGSNNVKIGRGSFINYNCFFDNSEKITIGENCSLAMDVLVCTSTHKISDNKKRGGELIGLPVIIKNGCWIGALATILPGVTVEDGCVIAAGAVVTKSTDANGVYAGVPAIRVKDI